MKILVGILIVAMSFSGCTELDCSENQLTGAASANASSSDGVLSYSGTVSGSNSEQYLWNMNAEKANVAWSGDLSSGSVDIQLLDDCGAEVYNASISAGSSSITAKTSGTANPGEWLMTVTMVNASGDVAFAVSPA